MEEEEEEEGKQANMAITPRFKATWEKTTGRSTAAFESTLKPSRFAWSVKKLERGDVRQLFGDRVVIVFLQLLRCRSAAGAW